LNRIAERSTGPNSALNWRVLSLLNLYRALVPGLLVSLYYLVGSRSLVVDSPRVFVATAVGYFLFAVLSVLLVRRRFGSVPYHSIVQATVDLFALTLLLQVCGGVGSGLGLLYLVPVGGLSFVLRMRSALFLAALATISVLFVTIGEEVGGPADIGAYTSAGLLGAVLFTIATAASFIAGRMRESEALVRQKDVDLANLAELSQYILQHLRESLLVVDAADNIRLINASAADILGNTRAVPDALLGEVSPRLLYSLSTWRRSAGRERNAANFVAADGGRVIQPYFAPLGEGPPGPTLIFLEDTTLMAERVQQSKLAALGRLSASIAHEIRNPVGAMSHAGQLLAESPAIGPNERRLTEIIRSNSDRVSAIINNVLQLSRREATNPQRLQLVDWLEDFVREFSQTMQIPKARIRLQGDTPQLIVRFDPGQLHQVVWNLCDNSLKYGATHVASPIEVRYGRLSPSNRPFLEVADRGAGIDEKVVERIFEPFFTGGNGGTGLGLYIARELCQLNRSVLLYEPRDGGGSVFRVVFSDPQRWEE
jgi:two-component system sensor histidine kinase PilS (NtrC family)